MDVMEWLLDSDPSIRWQVMRDLTDEPDEVVTAERARVARVGWGARLLELQAPDGLWGGGTYLPKWTSTHYTLQLLRDLGPDPADEKVRSAIGLVRDNVTHWDDGPPFFVGETEACINGMILAMGAYFGENTDEVLSRLLDDQLDDGGWNCLAPPSKRSSFHSTICVLEGLLEYQQADGDNALVAEARRRGEDYLLARKMLRTLSTGEVINSDWTLFSFPCRWHYDVLRGLDYMRAAGVEPDGRTAEAIGLVVNSRSGDGRWPLQNTHGADGTDGSQPAGEVHFDMDDGDGKPSRWNTLRALRVLNWAGRGS
ncbi:MAG TPA: hypothetical protein VE569_07890 [Acidimicrobiia bacterium]|nr:hypothetical protein [Acidimicrobiia bacterium]